MNYNKAIIAGRVTQKPELKTTTNGLSVTSFSVATNRHYKTEDGTKKEQVEYHNITAWGKLAEIAGQYLAKGQEVLIEGFLHTDKYEKDGEARYKTSITAEKIELGSRPKQEQQSEPAEQDGEEVRIEDIPF